ncbi:MAG: ATP-grasp domain-containing protein [Bacillota bacterium]|jgi:succinyl-CoA synthetase beta subunit
MALRVTELTFLEQYAERYGIPVPRHLEGSAKRSDIKEALEKWGGEALVKPDVLTGKRSKAGRIVSVNNVHDAITQLKRISSTEVNGKMPRTSYLVEKIPAEFEIFTAITYNSSFLQPSFTVCLEGGVDIEEIPEEKKITIPVDIFRGLDAYQVSEMLEKLGCRQQYISLLSRTMVSFWDMFISTGMLMAEINPWRVMPGGKPVACDFKATIDEANYKSKVPNVAFPDYPENISAFEEEMEAWSASSHQGQAHVSDLGGKKILPILFGGGASTIITETLEIMGGDPMFLSDFGGNPPYDRMYGTAKRCLDYKLADAKLLLILGGNANNTYIDVTFQAIGDALTDYVNEKGPIDIPVVVGRGGPGLVKGIIILKQCLESLKLPYVIFGPDTPVTLVAGYAAKLVNAISGEGGRENESN